jgi:hypothetical protein
VLPGGRYKTKDVAGDRHPADGWERQVTGHQGLAGRRQLSQETDPDADRLLGVVGHWYTSGGWSLSLSQAARSAGSALVANVAACSGNTPSLITSTSISPTRSA